MYIKFELFVAYQEYLHNGGLAPKDEILNAVSSVGLNGVTLQSSTGAWQGVTEVGQTVIVVAPDGVQHIIVDLAEKLARAFGERCVLVIETELKDATMVYPFQDKAEGYYTESQIGAI